MSDTRTVWQQVVERNRVMARLQEVRAALTWDQQTQMPPGGAAGRAQQIALLMGLHHEQLASPAYGELLAALAARPDLDEVQRAAVRNLVRARDRAVRVPAALVERIGRLQGDGYVAWMRAREANDHGLFLPTLAEIFDAFRERAQAIDGSRAPYDVLLEEYDPGMTTASLVAQFARLRTGLVELLDALRERPPMQRLQGRFDAGRQLALTRRVAQALGYDAKQGRIDLAEHPFTIHIGPGDVRITTRFDESDLLSGLGATIHETGHALYEQGIPDALYGTGVDNSASMAVHESQSRFWENTIGRSLPFFRWLQGPLREAFGADAPDADALYRAANRVEPGLVRVSADEVTYNLHVIVRFDLERALFAGELRPAELRDAWNDAYARDLGLHPPDDRLGVLQDVHWASGALGYFPSYTLGNLYAASFARKLEAELPDLWERVERGDFAPILGWLRDHIHRHGRTWDGPELMARVSGDRDPIADLLAHLWSRHGALHGAERPR